jgi:cytochrome P450
VRQELPLVRAALGKTVEVTAARWFTRMELRAAYPALARRFPDMAVATERIDYRELSIVYGLEALPVRLG